jgi:1-pyrroline-5-carboxylate dehydrogenase
MKITYATMNAEDQELQAAYDAGVVEARGQLGQTHAFWINGEPRTTTSTFDEYSPIDNDLLIGAYSQATPDDVDDAVDAARAAQPAWAKTPWQNRVAIMRKAADILDERLMSVSALLGFEVGKSRLEALGDVAETSEFLRYYAKQMEDHDGFVIPLNALASNESNVSVLRPYGVWAVISPFNFPLALAAGGSIGAMLTGNTVVLKPSNRGALAALVFYRLMADAGLPDGVLNVVTGGDDVGRALVEADVDGITFTGSYDVGMSIYHNFADQIPKPVVAEMGGKNPAIVTASADLDEAAEGVARGAFGFSGQKCSATSRVYVEESVFDEFVAKLVSFTEGLDVSNPIERDAFTGPVIDEAAVERYLAAVKEVSHSGGRILTGGERLEDDDLGDGTFVAPTVATVDESSWVWDRELFVPFVVVGKVESLDEALDKANDTDFGLTAGLFSKNQTEIDEFFDRIEAGVTYVNRRAGATTGAWPDIQSFGGWKGSGTSGAGGGGPWYLRSYLREQSRTIFT